MPLSSKNIHEIFFRFREKNPQPTTELHYRDHFELLIAVILSAQATDKSVNKATEKLFVIANTPEKMAALEEEGLSAYIKSIGLYKTKAKNIIATCKKLMAEFHSQVPCGREALESLPGVGRKTANVILNTCFNEPMIAVDTHIFRVANRTGLATGKTPFEVEKKLTKIIPTEFKKDAHHWLVLHGRYVCVARKPHCPTCIIADLCCFKEKTR